MSNSTTKQFDINVMFETIEHYEKYYNGKLTPRKKYIMCRAIERFIQYNELENPNQYLLYLIADKGLQHIKSKTEQGMITELEEELEKDIHIFKKSFDYDELLETSTTNPFSK